MNSNRVSKSNGLGKSVSTWSVLITTLFFGASLGSSLFGASAQASAVPANAKVIASSPASLSAASIDQIVKLVDRNQSGSSHKKLSVVVTDGGMSTDVSPRYTVYLSYASLAEMGNIWVDFELNNQVFKFITAKQKSPGFYELIVHELRVDSSAVSNDDSGEAMYEVQYAIDATRLFADEVEKRTKCGADFCDGELKSTVILTEVSAKKIR